MATLTTGTLERGNTTLVELIMGGPRGQETIEEKRGISDLMAKPEFVENDLCWIRLKKQSDLLTNPNFGR